MNRRIQVMLAVIILFMHSMAFSTEFHDEYIVIDYGSIPDKFTKQLGDSIELYDYIQNNVLYIPQKITKEDLIVLFGKNPDTILFGSNKHLNEITHIWNYKDFFIAIAIRDNSDLLMIYWRFFDRFGINGYKRLPWDKDYLFEKFGKPDVIRKDFMWYEINKGMRFDLDPFNTEDPNRKITGFLIYGKAYILHYD